MNVRKGLATIGLVGAMSLGTFGGSSAAFADVPRQVGVISADADPVESDGNSDSGKWGLVGLTGLVGLFGYKKYREHTHNRNAGGPGAPGASRL